MMFKTLQHLRWIVVSLAAFVLFHVAIENIAAKKVNLKQNTRPNFFEEN